MYKSGGCQTVNTRVDLIDIGEAINEGGDKWYEVGVVYGSAEELQCVFSFGDARLFSVDKNVGNNREDGREVFAQYMRVELTDALQGGDNERGGIRVIHIQKGIELLALVQSVHFTSTIETTF